MKLFFKMPVSCITSFVFYCCSACLCGCGSPKHEYVNIPSTEFPVHFWVSRIGFSDGGAAFFCDLPARSDSSTRTEFLRMDDIRTGTELLTQTRMIGTREYHLIAAAPELVEEFCRSTGNEVPIWWRQALDLDSETEAVWYLTPSPDDLSSISSATFVSVIVIDIGQQSCYYWSYWSR